VQILWNQYLYFSILLLEIPQPTNLLEILLVIASINKEHIFEWVVQPKATNGNLALFLFFCGDCWDCKCEEFVLF